MPASFIKSNGKKTKLTLLAGNDDSGEDKPIAPVKTVDKATVRTTKRNVEPLAPAAPAAATRGTGNRRAGPRGSEGAFRDRGAGSDRNHARSTDEAPRDGQRGGYGARVRGGRGSRRPRDGEDRQTSRSGAHPGSEKQAAQSWGATEGEAELKDEQAGDAIAQSEKKDALAEDAAGEELAEPEDKSVSYTEYLAQLADKKLSLGGDFKVRGANEGSKLDKKWANAKPIEKADDEEFISGSYGKKQRERERKVKQTLDFDPRFVEPERTRGGRGGDRGGRPGGRGGRGGERGGDRGRGGNFRGGRGGAPSTSINTKDESAFPSLGGK
ncbi:hypothetical protein QQS21_012208 [Conoideocrella luteorostrata]|uniref:Hyaluronan/mRNA-binding protein domain-containing protein n=1 Tax=Conoideocrella luteorostrata TaxID=1105319 RepID=A0AAJ0CCP9_9HYPO|nr:hypothetical protein QQS21_012208 [Conoideocrella luteorostrata]